MLSVISDIMVLKATHNTAHVVLVSQWKHMHMQ